jgi:hypothetical protein
MAKRTYHWCSVGRAPLEPCAVDTDVDKMGLPTKLAYTCGCADAFDLNNPDCKLVLYRLFDWAHSDSTSQELYPPELPEGMGGRRQAISRSHGWRPPPTGNADGG